MIQPLYLNLFEYGGLYRQLDCCLYTDMSTAFSLTQISSRGQTQISLTPVIDIATSKSWVLQTGCCMY